MILITGPESTGKSTLASQLSEELGHIMIPEYGRTYLEKNGPEYSYKDIEIMALDHMEQVKAADNNSLILDTYLLNYKIWSEYKFGKVSDKIIELLTECRFDLILLMEPDIEWSEDPLRENPGDRAVLFDIYKNEMEIIGPISFFFPKEKGLTIVIGKETGLLAGNTLYFFLHGIKHNKNVRFLTREKSILSDHPRLKNYILLFPSFSSFFKLLRASYIVVDHSHWSYYYPIYFFLSIRARRIHLWHGLTFKAVERGLIIGRYANFKARLFRRLIKYDAVISTSKFWTDNLYKKYFLFKRAYNYGYPRNDVLFREPNILDLTKVDQDKFSFLKSSKEKGFKIVIYAPTYRDVDGSDAFSKEHLNFQTLNAFLSSNKIILILKFHPRNSASYSDMSHIINYDKSFDVYPIMSLSDLLITDYSSIYIDYLIIDRPIIFFNYDYELYLKRNRSLQSTFLDTIPGVITYNQSEFENAIYNHLILEQDPLQDKRREMRDISYENLDGNSSERIYNRLENWKID